MAEVAHAGAEQPLDDLIETDGDKKEPMLHLAAHLSAVGHIHPGRGPALRDRDQTPWARVAGGGQAQLLPELHLCPALSRAAKPSLNTAQCTGKQGPPPNRALATGGLCHSLWADKGLNV